MYLSCERCGWGGKTIQQYLYHRVVEGSNLRVDILNSVSLLKISEHLRQELSLAMLPTLPPGSFKLIGHAMYTPGAKCFAFSLHTRAQSLDMIANSLESTAAKAKVGPEDGDMPAEGMRRLAEKLRRKLRKTPPRWQVHQRERTRLCLSLLLK